MDVEPHDSGFLAARLRQGPGHGLGPIFACSFMFHFLSWVFKFGYSFASSWNPFARFLTPSIALDFSIIFFIIIIIIVIIMVIVIIIISMSLSRRLHHHVIMSPSPHFLPLIIRSIIQWNRLSAVLSSIVRSLHSSVSWPPRRGWCWGWVATPMTLFFLFFLTWLAFIGVLFRFSVLISFLSFLPRNILPCFIPSQFFVK